jgi:hypothetical protein
MEPQMHAERHLEWRGRHGSDTSTQGSGQQMGRDS